MKDSCCTCGAGPSTSRTPKLRCVASTGMQRKMLEAVRLQHCMAAVAADLSQLSKVCTCRLSVLHVAWFSSIRLCNVCLIHISCDVAWGQ
jgi:hypothetical protein